MSHEDLESRVTRLEMENRRLRAVGTAVLIVMASIAALGQAAFPPGKRIEAEAILLKDEKGRTRVEIGVEEDGAPFLQMSDSGGNGRVQLRCRDARKDRGPVAGMILLDDQGRRRVQATTHGSGQAVVRVIAGEISATDASERSLAQLYALPEGGSQVMVKDASARTRASLYEYKGVAGMDLADEKGQVVSKFAVVSGLPSLGLYAGSGEPRLILGASSGGVSQVSVLDAKGRHRLSMGALADGTSMISFTDGEGQSRGGIAATPAGDPRVRFLDAEGKETYKAP